MLPSQPQGYLAEPPSGNGHSVMVLHAWWGLNETMKAFCTRLAESGFVAFAPDLYHGKVVDTIAGAKALSAALDENQAMADIATAAEFLLARSNQDKNLAVIGFSLGAYFALELSITDPDHVRSVVLFYGTGPTDLTQSKVAYLGHFGDRDEFEPKSSVDMLESALRSAGREVNFYTYSDTGHWFFEPDRPQAFNPKAAELAWERTLEFLNKSFK